MEISAFFIRLKCKINQSLDTVPANISQFYGSGYRFDSNMNEIVWTGQWHFSRKKHTHISINNILAFLERICWTKTHGRGYGSGSLHLGAKWCGPMRGNPDEVGDWKNVTLPVGMGLSLRRGGCGCEQASVGWIFSVMKSTLSSIKVCSCNNNNTML